MGRFFAAIGRFFSFLFLRRSEDIRRAADEQFTGSPEGIRAAFAIERDALARDFRTLQETVAEVLNIVEDRKQQLTSLDAEEERLLSQVEGALAAAEKAQAENNAEEFERSKAAHGRYSARLAEIDGLQEGISAQVTDLEGGLQRHMMTLTDLKGKLERLPQQEAEAVAEFVSAQKITELNNRLMNAQDSLRESPVAAVQERVKRLSAQARITEKLVGTDVKLQDQEYERLGAQSRSGTDFEALLAARKAKREGVTPEAREATPEQAPDRPQL